MKTRKYAAACLASLSLLLAACNNDHDDNDDGDDTPVPASAINGIAAIGSPIIGGNVRASCASGVTRNTTTSASGAWSVSVPTASLPCALRASGGTVNGGAANTQTLYSLTMGGRSTIRANITPMTDLALSRAVRSANGQALEQWFDANAPQGEQVANAVTAAQQALLADLAEAGYTVPEGFDAFTQEFQAVAGNEYDDLLEAVGEAIEAGGQGYEAFRNSYVDGGSVPAPVQPPVQAGAVPATHYIRRHTPTLEGVYGFSCGDTPVSLTLRTNGSFSVTAEGVTSDFSAVTPDYFFNYDASPGRPDDVLLGVGGATLIHFTLSAGQFSGTQPDQKVGGKTFATCVATSSSTPYSLPNVIKTFKGSYAASCGDAGAQVLTIGADAKLSIAGTAISVADAHSLIAHDSLQSEGSAVFADGTFKLARLGDSARHVEVTVDSPTSTIKKVSYRNGSSGADCSVSGPTDEPPAPEPANVLIAQKIGETYAGSYVLSCEDFSTSSGKKNRTVTINDDGSATLDGVQVIGPDHPGFISVVHKTINIFRDDNAQDLPKVLLYFNDDRQLTGGTLSEQPNSATNCTASGPVLPEFPLQQAIASYARSVSVTCTGEAISGPNQFVIDASGTASLGNLTITPEDYLQFRFFEFQDNDTFHAASGSPSMIYIGAVGKSLYAYLKADGTLESLQYSTSTVTNGVQSTKQGACSV